MKDELVPQTNSDHSLRTALAGLALCALLAVAPVAAAQPAAGDAEAPAPAQPPPGKAAPPAAGDDAPAARPKLPGGFVPPRKIPDFMRDDYGEELLGPQLTGTLTVKLENGREVEVTWADWWKGARFTYSKALRNGRLNGQLDYKVDNQPVVTSTEQLVDLGLKYRVYIMSVRELPPRPRRSTDDKEPQPINNRRELHQRRVEALRDVKQAADFQNNDNLRRQFREHVLETVQEYAEDLFDNQFHVRLNAALLLGQLDLRQPDDDEPPVMYDVSDSLLKLLEGEDPAQPTPIRIVAARGLKRLLRYGDLNNQPRYNIGLALAEQLEDGESHAWYQYRLVQALAAVDLLTFGGGRAFVIDTLTQVVVDDQRPFLARSEAAEQLGRVRLKPGGHPQVIAYAVANLAGEMAAAQQKQPDDPRWHDCFLNVYFAFQPYDKDDEGGLLNVVGDPAFASEKQAVQSAYRQILPLVQHVYRNGGAALPDEPVAALRAWLKESPPKDLKPHDSLDPIVKPVAAGTASQAASSPAG